MCIEIVIHTNTETFDIIEIQNINSTLLRLMKENGMR